MANKTCLLIGALVLALYAVGHTEDSLQTRFGLVETDHSSPDAFYIDAITVDGKPVFKEEDMIVSLHKKLEMGVRDVVLFGTNCGGTACTFDYLHFLVLQKGTTPKVVDDKNFFSEVGIVKPNVEKNRIVVDLGFDGGKRKTAYYDGEKITVALSDAKKAVISEKNCRWIYDNAVDGQCILEREEDPTCKSLSIGNFSGAVSRGIAAFSNYPAFDYVALEKLCLAACRSGKAEKYAVFKKSVCGIK